MLPSGGAVMANHKIWNGPALVVFDAAGTTIEDQGEVPDALVTALAEHGVRVQPEMLVEVRGSSKRDAILSLIPEGPRREERARAAYASFRHHLAQRYGSGVRPVAGAAETFRWLKTHGAKVALSTGFDRETTNLLLSAVQWASGVFDAIVCGDDVPTGRPAPYLIFRAMEATGTTRVDVVANVGDTTLDLQAADAAAVRWNIGVLSGAHDRERLLGTRHTHLLRDVSELPQVWSAV